MRIRKRPQFFSLQPSDPSTSIPLHPHPNAPRGQEHPVVGAKNQEERLHPDHVDLGAKSAPALPQGKVVALLDSSKSPDANATHESGLENNGKGVARTGIAKKPEVKARAGEVVPGGAGREGKGGGNGGVGGGGGAPKKRRSPAVLTEGSRCSRVNGRGWRCSQTTLVGYSLCEHHLGKGRLRSVSGGRGGAGTGAGGGQLGRTEHSRKLAAAAAPEAAEDPSLRHC